MVINVKSMNLVKYQHSSKTEPYNKMINKKKVCQNLKNKEKRELFAYDRIIPLSEFSPILVRETKSKGEVLK